MSLITKNRLGELTDSLNIRNKSFSTVLNEARNESRFLATTTIFLSHSHDDLEKDEIKKTIAFLRSLGLRIYIDANDSTMPPFTNGDTAKKIKKQIEENKKFILLATNLAINSQWCNWELGFGDAHKYLKHICLFPLTEKSKDWNGNEYLKIYPRIEEKGHKDFKVIFPDNTSISLESWLQN